MKRVRRKIAADGAPAAAVVAAPAAGTAEALGAAAAAVAGVRVAAAVVVATAGSTLKLIITSEETAPSNERLVGWGVHLPGETQDSSTRAGKSDLLLVALLVKPLRRRSLNALKAKLGRSE